MAEKHDLPLLAAFLPLLIVILLLTACAPLETRGGGILPHPIGLAGRQREIRNSLNQARELIRQGKLKMPTRF